jgi:hypothetical protein
LIGRDPETIISLSSAAVAAAVTTCATAALPNRPEMATPADSATRNVADTRVRRLVVYMKKPPER